MTRQQSTKRMASVTSAEDITIEFSTRSAFRLWSGRESTDKQRGILGVAGFARLLRSLEQAVREDDPYADFHFLRIEQSINELSAELNADLAAMTDLIASKIPSAMKVPAAVSEEPTVVPVKFSSRLGFDLVYQVLKVDQIALKVLLASHLALMSAKEKFTALANSERKVRAVMNKVFDYRYTGVTRDDMSATNQKALAAIKAMGELSEEYLSGELRSPNAPKLPRRRLASLKKPEVENFEEDKSAVGS
jgi:integrating conjugative element protein (TIGR03761 family)